MQQPISHHTTSVIPHSVETTQLVDSIAMRLKSAEQLMLPLEQTLDLLYQLSQFSLGRFLLHNRGLNGYWTAYVFRNLPNGSEQLPLESWLLNKSFLVMARERFFVFQQEITKHLRPEMTMASIPCGLMDDLLSLDYSDYSQIKLVGIDADEESLKLAQDNAVRHGLADKAMFLKRDAWHLGVDQAFDLISSNGLNMYESGEEKLVDLYRNFYHALTNNGTLVLSFIPPPTEGLDLGISKEDFLLERAIFSDIIQVNYLNFCTEEAIRRQLDNAGFIVKSIRYNAFGIAPVLVASKEN